eukprot:419936_1
MCLDFTVFQPNTFQIPISSFTKNNKTLHSIDLNMLFSLLLVLLASFSNAQDLEVDYFALRPALYGPMLAQLGGSSMETPIIIHIAHIVTVNRWNCLAYYDSQRLDILTSNKPKIITPKHTHTRNTQTLCVAYSWAMVADFVFAPVNEPNGRQKVEAALRPIYEQFGLTNIQFQINDEIYACKKDIHCLKTVAQNHNYSPYIIASIIVDDLIEEFETDGWNMHGLETTNDEICQANCYPYMDTTDYKPKSECNSWVPLLETDHRGFFYRHSHVTPHIGIKGKKYLLDEYVQAEAPQYNYEKEATDLILRLRRLANDDYQKAVVEFFDNKLNVRNFIFENILAKYNNQVTMEKMIAFSIGISFAEHEAILQAWNQKVYYDRIRPTTVIQRWGDKKIETYGGPYQGVKTIKAKYFEPYIRVMPHSEYPSASACICKAYQEFME